MIIHCLLMVKSRTLHDSVNSIVEDAKCPGLQDLIEVNHDVNKINFEINCLPSERMNLALLAGKVADDVNTNRKEEISDVVYGMELNSVTAQDVLMISPEKNVPSQNNISQEEETKISQSVLFDNKSLTTECHLLDSPGLNCSNTFTQVERRHQEHTRHIPFGGNLITFSPLRPLSGDQPEEF
ncbi:hypothetical protein J1605_000443 [Eschrichtius robustus]|uniref:Uncharacterized protein n=1 Tax=Eschrichtius robustus TaxID=9764 RepID=A0AB34H6P3_ESCRO|nr:hypothetical protein J1605_000443 [Eschrichtius robustus]